MKASRRRGTAVEDAILDAAWDEILEHGYSGLTLAAVAARAGTSRPVLSRRWPDRLALVTAALKRFLALHPITVPDLGSVRADLISLLRQFSARGTPARFRVMLQMSADLVEAGSSFSWLHAQITERGRLETILQRGVERGEIDPAKLRPRITSLPADLMRHEILMTLEGVPDAVIEEIVDRIFLPLVRP